MRLRLGEVEVERVEQVDGRAGGVDRHLRRHVQQRVGVVEDDLHAGVDELVGQLLGRRRRHGEDADDDVLVLDDLRQVVEEEDIVVGVLAVPTAAAQELADQLVDAGVKIIFNYSEALLHVPPEVTVHTSSPAVDLLYALYFYLT